MLLSRKTILAASRSSHYPMVMDSREAFVALNPIEGVGPVRARSLVVKNVTIYKLETRP